MTVQFYTFRKRSNSTMRPNVEPVLVVDAIMRNESSVVAPVLELHKMSAINTRTMNYVYIPAYDRYYFVQDWTWNAGIWEISLSEDALASWRDTIGSTRDYVIRSSYRYDGAITDNLYPMSGDVVIAEREFDSPYRYYSPTTFMSTYVVSLIGPRNTTSYYAMTDTQYKRFMFFLFSDQYADTIYPGYLTAYPELKVMLNPIQYVRSVREYPFVIDSAYLSANPSKKIEVGWGYIEIEDELNPGTFMDLGYEIKNPLIVDEITVTIPKHPQAAERGVYLNKYPYSIYELFFPPFGVIELDGDSIFYSAQIKLVCITDTRTGNAILKVVNNADDKDQTKVISWVSAKVSVEHTLSQIQAPGFGVAARISALMDMASAGLSGFGKGGYAGAALGAGSSFMESIGEKIKSRVPTSSTIGSDGGTATFVGACKLQATFSYVVNDDLEQRGRPLCDKVVISAVPGYIVIADPDFSCNGTAEEINTIRQFMEGGFYYE